MNVTIYSRKDIEKLLSLNQTVREKTVFTVDGQERPGEVLCVFRTEWKFVLLVWTVMWILW